jgi:hypothetical protein
MQSISISTHNSAYKRPQSAHLLAAPVGPLGATEATIAEVLGPTAVAVATAFTVGWAARSLVVGTPQLSGRGAEALAFTVVGDTAAPFDGVLLVFTESGSNVEGRVSSRKVIGR